MTEHHIAKPDGHKPCAVSLLALHNQFRYSFAGTHNVGRTNGLIGRNQNKSIHMMFDGHFHHHTAADNIIENGLPGIFLQHGHMLISRRVKHNFRFVFFKNIIH